jgi:WD40 repeat protein
MEEQVVPLELQAPVLGECTDILMQHKGDVWELAFSPNGRFMASAARDGTVIVWELTFDMGGAAGGRSLQVHHYDTQHLHETRNLPWHVSLAQKSSVFRTVHSLEEHVECLAWAPDSRSLLCCGSKSNIIQLWSVEVLWRLKDLHF